MQRIVTVIALLLALCGCTAVSVGSTVVGAAVSITTTAVSVGVSAATLGVTAGAAIIGKAVDAARPESGSADSIASEAPGPAGLGAGESLAQQMHADAGVELTPVAMPAVSIGESLSNPGTD